MFPIRRKVWILGALAKIFSLVDSCVPDLIAGVTAPQTALAVPASLDSVLQILPKMVFIVNALLVFVQPPFKAVKIPLFQVTGLRQKDPPVAPIVLDAPEIKAGTMLHRVSPDKLSVRRPLLCRPVGEAIGVMLRERHNAVIEVVKRSVYDPVS